MLTQKVYRFAILIIALTFILGGAYYWFSRTPATHIHPYDASKDRAALIEIFKQNWFWLTTNSDEADAITSFEHNIDTLSSSNSPFERGNMTILVYRDDEATKGFISYYRSGWSTAKILYIGVDEKYRRCGCAKELINYALEELKKQNYARVELFTRVINERAQNLYKKYGFTSNWTDGEYITYERAL